MSKKLKKKKRCSYQIKTSEASAEDLVCLAISVMKMYDIEINFCWREQVVMQGQHTHGDSALFPPLNIVIDIDEMALLTFGLACTISLKVQYPRLDTREERV